MLGFTTGGIDAFGLDALRFKLFGFKALRVDVGHGGRGRHGKRNIRQTVAQGGDPGLKIRISRRRRVGAQVVQGGLHGIGHLRQAGQNFRIGAGVMRDAAPHQGFGRRQNTDERTDFRHRERAVHGVDGAEYGILEFGMAGGGRTRQPGVQCLEMAADLRTQDFQQHRIDDRRGRRGRRNLRQLGSGFRHRGHENLRLAGGNDRGRLRLVNHVFAGSQAFGDIAQALHVDRGAFAQQGFLEARQRIHRGADHGQYGGAGRTRTVKHAVQQALDLPAEFTQDLGTDQAAATLERMEHAPDRTHQLDVVRIAAPVGVEAVQIRTLFGELLEEDFTDFVVDTFGLHVETGHGIAVRIGRRHGDNGGRDGSRLRFFRHGRVHRLGHDRSRNRRRRGRNMRVLFG